MREKKKIILTCGHFNLITPGHISFLKQARQLGDKLTILLDSDIRNQNRKKEKAIFSWSERAKILNALEFVSSVWELKDFDSFSNIISIMGDVDSSFLFVKGQDYDISLIDRRLKKILDKHNIPIAFIPYDERYSTTKVFEKIKTSIIENNDK